VGRVVELVGAYVLVSDPKLPDKRLGVALMRLGQRRGIGRDRHGVVTQNAVRSPCQVGGIGAARESDDYPAHPAQDFEKTRFLIGGLERIGHVHWHFARSSLLDRQVFLPLIFLRFPNSRGPGDLFLALPLPPLSPPAPAP